MFILDQIKQAHSKVNSGADFPSYIQEIKLLGVASYVTFVSDGHTDYYGADDYKITSDARYKIKYINSTVRTAEFKDQLAAHQQGKSDFPTFCSIAAELGIEKWIIRIDEMTCTYYDRAENCVLVEKIPG